MWSNYAVHLLVFIILALADIGITLKDMKVVVPASVRRGQNVVLGCQYDLEGDSLYSIKWYKGKREFFRFTPKENPSLKTFVVAGINIDIFHSNRSHVTILSVDPTISGKYLCEVSAEAPQFHTMMASSDMDVVDVPESKPIITEIRSRYLPGEIIKGNCTSQYSKPLTNLTWLVNDKPISSSNQRQYKPVRDEFRNLESRTIGIILHISHQYFMTNGRLKISCVAKVYNLYHETVYKIVEEERANVHLATSSLVGQNYALPSMHDHMSSFYDQFGNQNDAQVQADASSISSHIQIKISPTFVFLMVAMILCLISYARSMYR